MGKKHHVPKNIQTNPSCISSEVGSSTINNKCHQLHCATNVVNNAAKKTFIPGRNMSFGEGGFGFQSRLCPVRVYNQSKPNKFHVEVFALTNASKNAPINQLTCHLYMYQGKMLLILVCLRKQKDCQLPKKL